MPTQRSRSSAPNVRDPADSRHRHTGDKTFCWIVKDGHVKRTEVRTGVTDGEYVEITSFASKAGLLTENQTDIPWLPITGTEEVVSGDISTLTDDEEVEISKSPAMQDEKKSATAQQIPRASRSTWPGSPECIHGGLVGEPTPANIPRGESISGNDLIRRHLFP